MRIGFPRATWLLAAGCGLAVIASLSAVAPAMASASAGIEGDEAPATVQNTVKLEIQIAGLGAKGGKVVIKPAHPGCKFKAFEKAIPKDLSGDLYTLPPMSIAATTTSADRDCSFEITLMEQGREPKTFRRGLRLTPTTEGALGAPSKTLRCYLPATTVAIKDPSRTNPRR